MILEEAVNLFQKAGLKVEITGTGTESKKIIGGKNMEKIHGINLYTTQSFVIRQNRSDWLVLISIPNSSGLLQSKPTLADCVDFILAHYYEIK